jgi:hypothetical protein
MSETIKKPKTKHKTKCTKKPKRIKIPKLNSILGFYTKTGNKVDQNQNNDSDCDYVQIELLGGHARDIKNNSQINLNDNTQCCSEGYIMLVSKQDINNVMNYKWYLSKSGYPGTYGSIHADEENWGAPYPMHRFLYPETPKGYVVDHINRNRLDNRRENLRIITAKQNSFNRKKPKNSKNTYKGVRKLANNKFKAVISKDGKTYSLKDCNSEKEAALLYDMMAEQLFGVYAGKNFPD